MGGLVGENSSFSYLRAGFSICLKFIFFIFKVTLLQKIIKITKKKLRKVAYVQ